VIELWVTVFCMRSVPRLYDGHERGQSLLHGGGFEYHHRSLASRKKRRKGNPLPGAITGSPCSWGIKIRGPDPPGSRSIESEAQKYGNESLGIRIREWLLWRLPAAILNGRPVLSSRMAPYVNKPTTDSNKMWSWDPDGCLTSRPTFHLPNS
jgi:hypothetical protein